jgi:hypothetical protein
VVVVPNIEKCNTLGFSRVVVSTDILNDMCDQEIQFAVTDQCVSKTDSLVGKGMINRFLFEPSL